MLSQGGLQLPLTGSFFASRAFINFSSMVSAAEAPASAPFEKTDEQALIKRPWSSRPFSLSTNLDLPIYNLHDGEFSGENVSKRRLS